MTTTQAVTCLLIQAFGWWIAYEGYRKKDYLDIFVGIFLIPLVLIILTGQVEL